MDGKRVATYKVNLNQIGIPLQRGQRYIEIEYRPTYFYYLRMISKAVIALLLVSLIVLSVKSFMTNLTKRDRSI